MHISEEDDRLELFASYLSTLANKNRLYMLRALESGEKAKTARKELGITRGGMQNHLDKLMLAGLIKKVKKEGRSYEVTPFGEKTLDWLEEMRRPILKIQKIMTEAGEEAEEKEKKLLESGDLGGFGMEISKSAAGAAKRRMLWKLAKEEVERVIKEEMD